MLAFAFFLNVISKAICVHHWVYCYSVGLTTNSKVVANLTEMRAVASLLSELEEPTCLKKGN